MKNIHWFSGEICAIKRLFVCSSPKEDTNDSIVTDNKQLHSQVEIFRERENNSPDLADEKLETSFPKDGFSVNQRWG